MVQLLITVLIGMMDGEVYLPAPHETRSEPVAIEPKIEPSEGFNPEPDYIIDIYEITAYTAGYESTGKNPGDPYYGVTASGVTVEEGTTIACPPELDFGTVVEIEVVGKRICQDRGGAIKGKRLDLYMEDLSEALDFGRRKLEVKIFSS